MAFGIYNMDKLFDIYLPYSRSSNSKPQPTTAPSRNYCNGNLKEETALRTISGKSKLYIQYSWW